MGGIDGRPALARRLDQRRGVLWVRRRCTHLASGLMLVLSAALASAASGQVNEGPGACRECHDAEYDTWKETQHAEGVKDLADRPEAKKILEALGESSPPKRTTLCVACHYTVSRTHGSSSLLPRTGPSCESCHGPSSEWLRTHGDYGGRQVTKRDESPEHRTARIQQSTETGMVWPFMRYDLAARCNRCHGINPTTLDGDALAALAKSGHPIDTGFELVKYSQGSVRHRFYPPDIDVNQEMSREELARFWVAGQAAQLVVATEALAKADEPKFVAVQKVRVREAVAALAKLGAMPEAAALVAEPNEENARRLLDAIAASDVTGAVAPLLPDPALYK